MKLNEDGNSRSKPTMKKIETLEPRCSNGQKSSQLRDTTVRPVEGKQGEEIASGHGCEVEAETELEDFEARAEVEEYKWLS